MGDGSDGEMGKAQEEAEDHTPEESDPTDTDFNIQEELQVTTKSSTKEVQVEHIPVQLEDKGDRPYSCNLCGNRFKEVQILYYAQKAICFQNLQNQRKTSFAFIVLSIFR